MTTSGVVRVETFAQYDGFFRDAICKKLGTDAPALKVLEVKRTPLTDEDRIALAANNMNDKMITISGALGLNDIDRRVFEVVIEEGLSIAQDTELADSLAHQCFVCVNQMKKDRAKGYGVHHVN